MTTSVVFANNNPGMVTSRLFETFVQLYKHDKEGHGYLQGFIVKQSGGLLSIFRNRVVAAYLDETEGEWLWFVDSDISLETDTLDRLMETALEADCRILGALYFIADATTFRPLIYKRKRLADGTVKVAAVFNAWDPWPRDKLLQVDAVGMGCTLIHRDVLLEMQDAYGGPQPWFSQDIDRGILCGEDVSFCLKAAKIGYPTYLHTGIEVGHEKTQLLSTKALGLDASGNGATEEPV